MKIFFFSSEEKKAEEKEAEKARLEAEKRAKAKRKRAEPKPGSDILKIDPMTGHVVDSEILVTEDDDYGFTPVSKFFFLLIFFF